MPVRTVPSDLLTQASDILAACQQIDPTLTAGAITQATFADTLTQAQQVQTQINSLERQLTDLRNRRDDHLRTIWESVKRLRATVKGVYGDDSSEYELVGGTRISDRKRGGRRVAV